MDPDYQDKHTEFVSHNNGSTILEIVTAGLPLHLSPLLVSLASLLPCWDAASKTFRLFELITVLIPSLLSLTILSDTPEYIIAVLAALVVLVTLVIFVKRKGCKDLRRLWELKLSENGKIEAVTNYRSSMLLVTAICILAVDFPIFPRKFGKTETFGYGLMDLGVGGFVFAAGLISPEGRGKDRRLFDAGSLVPLLVLGAARLAVVTATGYHTNVTEYGTHWNFFFSLFAVKILGRLIAQILPCGRSVWMCSVVTAVAYEGLLSFGLADWILADGGRVGLLASNREGICSVLGYLAIYLAGVSWAAEIFTENFNFMFLLNCLTDCLVWSVLMWMSLAYSTTFFLPPSRRLCNYTFYTFVVAYNLSILSVFLAMEAAIIALKEYKFASYDASVRRDKSKPKIKKKSQSEKEVKPAPTFGGCLRCPHLFSAISFNPLLFFLLANLLTGFVNVCVGTMETADCPAILLLVGYLAVLSLTAILLKQYNVKLL